jgi:hypothetical protein
VGGRQYLGVAKHTLLIRLSLQLLSARHAGLAGTYQGVLVEKSAWRSQRSVDLIDGPGIASGESIGLVEGDHGRHVVEVNEIVVDNCHLGIHGRGEERLAVEAKG